MHRIIETTTELELQDSDGCLAAACVVLDATGKASEDELLRQLQQRPQLKIIRDGRAVYDISVIDDASLLPATGVTDGRELQKKFRESFPSLWDYIPPPDPLGFLKKFRGAVSGR